MLGKFLELEMHIVKVPQNYPKYRVQRYISYISYVNMIIKQMLSQTFRKLKIALNGEI